MEDLFKTLGECLRPEDLNKEFKQDNEDMKRIDVLDSLNCINCETQNEKICDNCSRLTALRRTKFN